MKTQAEVDAIKARINSSLDQRGEIKYDDIGHYCTCGGTLEIRGIRGSSRGESYLYVCKGCQARTWSGLYKMTNQRRTQRSNYPLDLGPSSLNRRAKWERASHREGFASLAAWVRFHCDRQADTHDPKSWPLRTKGLKP